MVAVQGDGVLVFHNGEPTAFANSAAKAFLVCRVSGEPCPGMSSTSR